MKRNRKAEIANALKSIADGAQNRLPLWTVLDNFTCNLMREAASVIHTPSKRSKRK